MSQIFSLFWQRGSEQLQDYLVNKLSNKGKAMLEIIAAYFYRFLCGTYALLFMMTRPEVVVIHKRKHMRKHK